MVDVGMNKEKRRREAKGGMERGGRGRRGDECEGNGRGGGGIRDQNSPSSKHSSCSIARASSVRLYNCTYTIPGNTCYCTDGL